MNYKLTNYKFVEIIERKGFIENNSGDILELTITKIEPKLDNPNNTYLKPHNKFSYKLNEGEKLYAKLVTRLSGDINVFEGDIGGAELENIKANQIIFEDGKTFQDKLNDGSLRGQKGNTGAKGEDGRDGRDGKSAFNELGQIEYPIGTKEWIV